MTGQVEKRVTVGAAQSVSLPPAVLAEYPFYHVARADALTRVGRTADAGAAYEAAIARTQNAAEQAYLRSKLDQAREP